MTAKRITDARFYKDLGQNIRFAREAAGKSQTDTSGFLGVSFQQVQKYENGTNRIPVDRLVALAAYFDIGLAALLDFAELRVQDGGIDGIMHTLGDPEFRTLLRCWGTIKDVKKRTALLCIVEGLAGNS